MSNYALEIYCNMFISLKRGNHRGVVSNAKPIFLISMIEAIPFIGNQFNVDNLWLKDFYKGNESYFSNMTPFVAPFFHLNSEPFYHLKWKENVTPPSNSHTPSAKFLRENLLYAKLDDELWSLLQDAGNREYLKQAIIDQYLKD